MHATCASAAQVSSAPPQTPGARRFRRGMSGFTLATRIKYVLPEHGQRRHAPVSTSKSVTPVPEIESPQLRQMNVQRLQFEAAKEGYSVG